jgi:hypothetical protein
MMMEGKLTGLGASAPENNFTDQTAEPVFVRGMLRTLDPKLTAGKANDLVTKAHQRLWAINKATGSYRVPVGGYTVVFGKGGSLSGGTRFHYDLEVKK